MSNAVATELVRTFRVPNRLGFHLRAATVFVRTVAIFESEIKVKKDDQTVNGKSIMELIMLAAAQGELLTVTTRGGDARATMKTIADLFDRKFDED